MITSSRRVRAPAKLNIRLKITGRRPDGYHSLVSIMVPVDLSDVLELKAPYGNRIEIQCRGKNVPSDESNLAFRAAKSFMSRLDLKDGVSIHLEKKIPVAAGLGGGSSDAAAVILALNDIYSRPLSLSDLHRIAVGIGADVPFFLEPKPSLATGIGDILEPLDQWPELWYVIVTPPIHVSTSWVYGNLKLELTTGEYDYILSVLKNDNFVISRILENDLEKVTSASFPIISTIKKALIDRGAEGAIMSGSGPSVFGLFSSHGEAESAKESLVSRDLGDIFVVRGGGT